MSDKIVVKYVLNSDGTVPNSIINGGHVPKPNGGTPPQDYDFVGFYDPPSDDDGLDGGTRRYSNFTSFASEADLKSYLDTYTTSSSWDHVGMGTTGMVTTPFDQVGIASMLWAMR